MYNFWEFRRKPDRLIDLLPWALLDQKGIILNKDGSFQKSYRYRGPDLDSSTREELISISARLNNVFKRLGSGWCIFAEAQRVRSNKYPESFFPDFVTTMIDNERKEFFSAEKNDKHYDNCYYFTLVYLPPSENISNMEKYFVDKNYDKEEATYQTHYKTFVSETERIFSLFKEVMSVAEPLTEEETLTYLHSTISTKRHPVKPPAIPMYLDAYISDSELTGGWFPKLGMGYNQKHLRAIGIKQFPGTSIPGLLNKLNRLDFEYRWTSRFLCLDKTEAAPEIKKCQRNWFSKRKGAGALVKDMMMGGTQGDSYGVTNTDALIKSNDADMALQELEGDFVSYGYFTMNVVVMDSDQTRANKKAQLIEKAINSLGFNTINETINAVDAWLGTIPGLFRANIRRPLLNTLNMAHLFPLSAIWAGAATNKHFNAPALMQTQTPDGTPFRFNLHNGDLGHAFVVGPPGMGKSMLLALIAAQFTRYKNSQVYFFDKDGSCRTLTAGVGGDFFDLADEQKGGLSFQPLSNITDNNERAWALEWLCDFLRGEHFEVNPEIKDVLWKALISLSSSPKELRTISGLTNLTMDVKLRLALQPLTETGAYGNLFDSNFDNLEYGRWQVFEMAKLMNLGSAIAPTLSYLFHRLEQRFTGAPSILILDECWIFLSNPIFAEKIREWLKVLRKKNVSVVFATQSLSDIMKSSVSSSIIESCLTRIFLPNPSAQDQTTKPLYQSFGLNEREIQLISEANPKQQYYYKSPDGSRLFELAIGKIALAYCGSSRPEDQQMVKLILKESGQEHFNEEWLKYKNLPDGIRILEELKSIGGVA